MLKKVFLISTLLVMTMFMIMSCSGENSLTGGAMVNLDVENNNGVNDESEDISINEDDCNSCESSYDECKDVCESESSGDSLEFCAGICDHKYCYCSEKECDTSPSIC
ncbi:hypothetical protein HN385_04030 [archaeon]|mgnify:FL=1|jgi:hypothetical protein|nr:hypothetical protein [archaeon]MBT3451245.1 hypothetical protein [archaeon]MBT6869100.1 hypothetical protein [archaeon]MBT7193343.1 hypothetical protein [archaeon]MBT7380351.1 hypothetical protein [archaeon]